MALKPQLPFIIQSLINRLEGFIDSNKVKRGRPGIWRAMRIERAQACLAVLYVLANASCMAFDGAAMLVVNGQAFPMTIKEIAKRANLNPRRVDRVLFDLRLLGLITSSTQIRKCGPYGLEVGPVLRVFTKKFWQLIGLWGQFVEAVKYATANNKLRVAWRFKLVNASKRKAQNAADNKTIERQQKQRNAEFQQYISCLAAHGNGCIGGYASEAVCKICRNMRK